MRVYVSIYIYIHTFTCASVNMICLFVFACTMCFAYPVLELIGTDAHASKITVLFALGAYEAA